MSRTPRKMLFVIVICLCVTASVYAEENPLDKSLFGNSGFEVEAKTLRDLGAAEGWGKFIPEGTGYVKYAIDREVVHSGEGSQRITGNRVPQGVRASIAKYLDKVNPGEVYRFSVWVKVEDIVPGSYWTDEYQPGKTVELVPNTNDLLGPMVGTPSPVAVRILWAGTDNQGLDNYYVECANAYMFADTSITDWQKLEIILEVPTDMPYSKDILSARIDLFLFRANGTVWWDDFEAVRLK